MHLAHCSKGGVSVLRHAALPHSRDMGVGRPVRFITLLNYCSDSSRQLINVIKACPSLAMSASAAPAPDRAALLACALACPVCSESFRRTHSLCCAQCTCGPFHREGGRQRQR